MPINKNRFTVQEELMQASTAETGPGTAANDRGSKTARAVEVWANVTAVTGASLEIIVEASIDGTNFVELGRTAAISAVGVYTLVFNRADASIGKVLRARWALTDTATFDIKMIRME